MVEFNLDCHFWVPAHAHLDFGFDEQPNIFTRSSLAPGTHHLRHSLLSNDFCLTCWLLPLSHLAHLLNGSCKLVFLFSIHTSIFYSRLDTAKLRQMSLTTCFFLWEITKALHGKPGGNSTGSIWPHSTVDGFLDQDHYGWCHICAVLAFKFGWARYLLVSRRSKALFYQEDEFMLGRIWHIRWQAINKFPSLQKCFFCRNNKIKKKQPQENAPVVIKGDSSRKQEISSVNHTITY